MGLQNVGIRSETDPASWSKYPALFKGVAVKLLNQMSIRMRDLKQIMRENEIKVVYKGRRREMYDAIVYDMYNSKSTLWRNVPLSTRKCSFGEIEKTLKGIKD